MKKLLFLLLAAAWALPALAQHTELIDRAGASFSQYRGNGTGATSFVNYNYDARTGSGRGYANNPYGSRLGAGFALGWRVQRVGRRRGLLAADLGYDWARSRTAIDALYYSAGYVNTAYAATGTAYLRTQSLAVFLGLGRRFQRLPLALDVLVGPELAGSFSVRETGRGTYGNGTAWTTDADRGGHQAFDARLRADATAWHRRMGFNASFSYGFANAAAGLVGGPVREAHARTLRLGLAYRLL